jgi:hypothetical protein
MRVAFNILETAKGQSSIQFFNATDLHENPAPVSGFFQQDSGTARITWTTTDISRWNRMLMRFLHEVNKLHGGTPLKLTRALLGLGGKQVVFDQKHGKYRNLSTAQDAAKTYALVGTKLVVDAEDEKEAMHRARARITREMQDQPTSAEKLAAWFTGGCKLKLVESGEVPKPVSMLDIAWKDENKLAEQPIEKLTWKRQDEKEDSAP